jgi:hypothetical protein
VGVERQAALERQAAMVEELRKAELVRDRLESLEQLVRSYPEGHDTRVLLENLHLDRAFRAVEGDVRALRDALPSWHLISRRAPEKPASMLAGGQGCLDGC